MNCASSIIKYILYIMNLVFVLCGILLIALGSIVIGNMGDFQSFGSSFNVQTIPILIIVLGCVIFVISFFGCCGAIRENSCCMYTYAIFMFILFVLQLTLSIWILVKRQQFINAVDKVVQEAFEKNDQANGYPMDALQMTFNCCGVKSYQDYVTANLQVPNSCCGSRNGVCLANVYQSKRGCSKEFVNFWLQYVDIASWAGFGVAVFELVVFAFSCCLAGQMRRSRGRNC